MLSCKLSIAFVEVFLIWNTTHSRGVERKRMRSTAPRWVRAFGARKCWEAESAGSVLGGESCTRVSVDGRKPTRIAAIF